MGNETAFKERISMNCQRTHAKSLLKKCFAKQDVDKIRKARKLVLDGKQCPLPEIGNEPQDQHMVFKVLSDKQIAEILKDIIAKRPKIRISRKKTS